MSAMGSGSPGPLDQVAQPNTALQKLPALPAPSSNPRRLPPPCWSYDETVALIDAYCDKWYALRRGNLKAYHWQEVADDVARICPAVSPGKTAVQCRHKMEKLRKRYRTEIQRAQSMPISRFCSSWVHFKRMDDMEKGPMTKPDYTSDSDDDDDEGDDNEDEDDAKEDYLNQGLFVNHYRNGSSGGLSHAKGAELMYLLRAERGCSVADGENKVRVTNGATMPQPDSRTYPTFSQKNQGWDSNPTSKPNFGNTSQRSGVSKALKPCEEARGKKREREPIEEMVAAIQVLGDGFVRMEQMKMEMARELETMRMDMEIKRTEMILESQQRIVEAFAKAFSENSKKKKKKTPEIQSSSQS